MKVGDKVWLFDGNRRVYPKSAGMSCAPIYSEHFYSVTIDSETSRSWIVDGVKFPKNNPIGIYTDQQKEDMIWARENRRKIIDVVDRCSAKELREIYNLLFKPDSDA